jgi:hypothetical protein
MGLSEYFKKRKIKKEIKKRIAYICKNSSTSIKKYDVQKEHITYEDEKIILNYSYFYKKNKIREVCEIKIPHKKEICVFNNYTYIPGKWEEYISCINKKRLLQKKFHKFLQQK